MLRTAIPRHLLDGIGFFANALARFDGAGRQALAVSLVSEVSDPPSAL
jgi:hypothetical protein